MDETEQRRIKQIALAQKPTGSRRAAFAKQVRDLIDGVYSEKAGKKTRSVNQEACNGRRWKMSEKDVAREIKRLEKLMLEHARNLEFEQAARVRDQLTSSKDQPLVPLQRFRSLGSGWVT